MVWVPKNRLLSEDKRPLMEKYVLPMLVLHRQSIKALQCYDQCGIPILTCVPRFSFSAHRNLLTMTWGCYAVHAMHTCCFRKSLKKRFSRFTVNLKSFTHVLSQVFIYLNTFEGRKTADWGKPSPQELPNHSSESKTKKFFHMVSWFGNGASKISQFCLNESQKKDLSSVWRRIRATKVHYL